MNTDIPQPPPFFPGEPTPPTPASLPDKLDLRAILEALLRSPKELVQRLADPGNGALGRFIGIAVVSMLVFGVVLGSFAMHEQLWAAPLKITLGLLIAGLICFPSLYIFSCLAGSRAGASQLAATLAGMLALAGLLLLGFAPAVWIFTQATNAFGFMGVLAVAPWLVALAFGVRFLRTAIGLTGATGKVPINVWSCIFLLVTLQMTTSLRPILGREAYFLTDEKKFFIQHWIEVAGKSLVTSPRTEAPAPAP
jgi:hypothetical protein